MDKKYIVVISVNEEILRSNYTEDNRSTEDIVEAEFGWLAESGIILKRITEED